ncbi:hypothetical protein AQ490_13215 [Wenjunlia vitaminophila]|uniref:Uncharacterized protein n=1 Tax=Wenjunlia vitaminophila TaxID=76728 RepID=A0A0T6LXK9_WENVI|nr:monovalent cation/H(+) antiporter subunit G [Wenjunlia vitaminophila]KRV50903.1 hypothetical protein AQ490_13215 [Wenjunlia vitaminophila]
MTAEDVRHVVAVGLAAAGTGVVVLSALAALTMREVYGRLHFLTPVTSLGAPLIGVALAVENGWGLTAALDLLTAGLLTVTGPALAAATGRVAAHHDGLR